MTRTIRNIELSPEERRELEKFTKTGKRSVKLVKRAAVILALDTSEGRKPDAEAEIARRTGVSRQTVQNVKKDFEAAADLPAFLQRKKRETPPRPPKVTGELEARIIALACSKPPAGYRGWTLRLLADTCVELQYVDTISHMTISRLLKKHR
jgi:transposase